MKCCPGDFGVVIIRDRVCKLDRDDCGSGRLEYQPNAARSGCLRIISGF